MKNGLEIHGIFGSKLNQPLWFVHTEICHIMSLNGTFFQNCVNIIHDRQNKRGYVVFLKDDVGNQQSLNVNETVEVAIHKR